MQCLPDGRRSATHFSSSRGELQSATAYESTAWTETRPLHDGHAGFVKMARDPGATLKLVLKP